MVPQDIRTPVLYLYADLEESSCFRLDSPTGRLIQYESLDQSVEFVTE